MTITDIRAAAIEHKQKYYTSSYAMAIDIGLSYYAVWKFLKGQKVTSKTVVKIEDFLKKNAKIKRKENFQKLIDNLKIENAPFSFTAEAQIKVIKLLIKGTRLEISNYDGDIKFKSYWGYKYADSDISEALAGFLLVVLDSLDCEQREKLKRIIKTP